MNGDLISKIILSFLIPFLMLFALFSITTYKTFGFYGFALSFLYFLLTYILSCLRYKSITSNNIIFFRFVGRLMVTAFMLFLCFILIILINIKVPYVYEYIKF